MKSERTKNLSAAPWKVEEWIHGKGAFVVRNNKGYLVAENMSEQDANRLARLPELYDKLAEATKHYCGICHNLSGQDEPKIEDLIKNGCPKAQDKNRAHVVSCVALDWLELLRKVRNGK